MSSCAEAGPLPADKALVMVPEALRVARAERQFLLRAVRYLARSHVRQFVGLGTGFITKPSVHEAARFLAPGARVVYVDSDPVVMLSNRTILTGHDHVIAVHGDIRSPMGIMRNAAVRRVIDVSQPVAVLCVGILHFLSDADDPYNAVRAFSDYMALGSCAVISHITSDGADAEAMASIRDAHARASAPIAFRTQREITRFFSGLDLLKPGLVDVSQWRGNNRRTHHPPLLRIVGGVGRKSD